MSPSNAKHTLLKDHKMPRQNVSKNKAIAYTIHLPVLILVLILATSSALCLSFYYGVSPISGSDNYIYSSNAAQLLSKGFASLNGGGVLSTKYIIIFGEALFMYILGPNSFSVALFAILCALVTMVALYIIGSELYGVKTGLLAAAFYGFVPIVIVQASNAGDDVPMALFATLSVMFLVLGIKRKKHSGYFYLLSGFMAVIGSLAVGEELIIFVFIALFLFWRVLRNFSKGEILKIAAFFLGAFAAGLLIMFLGYVQSGNPFYVYNTSSSWYSTTYCGSPSWDPSGCALASTTFFRDYLGMMFPYMVTSKLATALTSHSVLSEQLLASLINPAAATSDYGYQFGYYFYLAALFSIILLALRDKRILFPLAWFAATILYLSFGTMSVSNYIRISPVFDRFLILLLPSIALIIALGLTRIIEFAIKGNSRKAPANKARIILGYSTFAVITAALLIESSFLIMYLEYSWYNNVYPIVQTGVFIESLPQNAQVLTPIQIPIQQYSDFRQISGYINEYGATCGQIPNNSYVVYLLNATFQSECNLTIAFYPQQPPSWLLNYSLYKSQFLNFSEIRVYYKNSTITKRIPI